ncbi:MAG: hypothetical protein JXB35_05395 [Anaerolineae bacterium]|nr:hypothetical protein [Anaerolineae bacterium]
MRRKTCLILLVGLLLLAFAGVALAAPVPVLERSVMASGGGRGEQGGIALIGALGQPVAGRGGSGGTTLCTGFWCSGGLVEADHIIYLPLLAKNP